MSNGRWTYFDKSKIDPTVEYGHFIIIEDSEIDAHTQIANMVVVRKSKIGKHNKLWNYLNIYSSEIGDRNTISSFCEIGGSRIGNNCKIEAMVYMPLGITLGNNVFIGPGVRFANDKYPRVVDNKWEWTVGEVHVADRSALGIGTTVLPNVKIGEHSFIAAGSLVSKDIPPNSFAMGRPAQVVSLQTLKELGVV